MTTVVVTHRSQEWRALGAKAWHKGPGSRHELVAKPGGTARNFRDPQKRRIWSASSLKCQTCRR